MGTFWLIAMKETGSNAESRHVFTFGALESDYVSSLAFIRLKNLHENYSRAAKKTIFNHNHNTHFETKKISLTECCIITYAIITSKLE